MEFPNISTTNRVWHLVVLELTLFCRFLIAKKYIRNLYKSLKCPLQSCKNISQLEASGNKMERLLKVNTEMKCRVNTSIWSPIICTYGLVDLMLVFKQKCKCSFPYFSSRSISSASVAQCGPPADCDDQFVCLLRFAPAPACSLLAVMLSW